MQGRLLLSVRLFLIGLIALGALAPATPASAASWVQNFAPAELWSGSDANAISFGTAPQWDYFEVVGPPRSGRIQVRVARTNGLAFVDAAVLGPSGSPPVGWPNAPPSVPAPVPDARAAITPIPGFPIGADAGLWPALQVLQRAQHTWTLNALSSTGTQVAWGILPLEAAGAYIPSRSLILVNARWSAADPRALAAILEHEAKHVADMLAGLDVNSPSGCITTEINAFREEAKTWGELVGPNGKPQPRDELEESLNDKLLIFQREPERIRSIISQNAGYRIQCQVR